MGCYVGCLKSIISHEYLSGAELRDVGRFLSSLPAFSACDAAGTQFCICWAGRHCTLHPGDAGKSSTSSENQVSRQDYHDLFEMQQAILLSFPQHLQSTPFSGPSSCRVGDQDVHGA